MIKLFSSILVLISLSFGRHNSDSSSNNEEYEFDSDELISLRDTIRSKILAQDSGLIRTSPFVSPEDFVLPIDLPLIAGFVRLTFHDCSGNNPGLCDGCIDINNSENAGINEASLEPIMDICYSYALDYGLSIADCWALAATFALELSAERTQLQWQLLQGFIIATLVNVTTQQIFEGDIPYYVGRKDCDNSPYVLPGTLEEFPDPTLGWEMSKEYFKSRFKLTNQEIVALIAGGHSLGHGHVKFSGYSGIWENSPNVIDNEFCRDLLVDLNRFGGLNNWFQSIVSNEPNAKPQFHPEGFPAFMLNSDIELAYDLTYYFERGLNENIDCSTHAINWCNAFYPGSKVLMPNETNSTYPSITNFCPFKQCPIKCAGGQNELNSYLDNNFENLDKNAECPIAFVHQFLEDEQLFNKVFVRAFIKMITAGYTKRNGKVKLRRIYIPNIDTTDIPQSHSKSSSSRRGKGNRKKDSESSNSSVGNTTVVYIVIIGVVLFIFIVGLVSYKCLVKRKLSKIEKQVQNTINE